MNDHALMDLKQCKKRLIADLAENIGTICVSPDDLAELRLAQRNITQEDMVMLLATKTRKESTPIIHILAFYNNQSLLIDLLRGIPSGHHFRQLMQIKDNQGVGILIYTLIWNKIKVAKCMLKRIGEHRFDSLLEELDNQGNSALHWAINYNHALGDILKGLGKSIPNLLSVRNNIGQTVLSSCVHGRRYQSFTSILDFHKIDEDNLLNLALMADNTGNSCFYLAVDQPTQQYLIDFLKATYSRATRGKLVEHLSNRSSKNGLRWRRSCDAANLLVYDWALKSLLNNQYLLFGRPSVIIMYSTECRNDAESEAQPIIQCFKEFGFDVTPDSSFTEKKLFKAIKDKQSEAASHNGQIVVLMSHGSEGCIEDSYGTRVPIRDIEQKMCPNTHAKTPKLLILQCCQEICFDDVSRTTAETKDPQSEFSDPASKNTNRAQIHSSYSPRSPDFCALVSTGPGSYSERNTFIPILAKEIRDMPINSSVSELMDNVKGKFPVNIPEQAPGSLDFLKHKFCLKYVLPIYLNIKQKELEKERI